ncbi:hypothetical protein SAMN05443287_102210 [Micromonospora phaseoli]|uniref:Uncharacterized protein n=1 Tax=Micromonospora phaseoli TaxID=1144548 RepID=A0A1H6UKJ5_9ACTN|nr:hypothetical protein [Micromonospora phaseoli]PZV98974.1 hypothetical protein CLV64_104211 [Micromonospora phaseoli]GIJ76274.1 hypothetical protein Xph01_07060 [Micromonospora phaseoli]SEI90257.1 hypothetical protein SAMN05443287_102210 [Micromonospora phaseoli]
MSISDVKAALGEADQLLDQGKTTIEGVGAALDEVSGLVLATLHDTRRAEAEQARKAITDAIREVELTLRTIAAAQDNGNAYRQVLG